MWLKELNLLLKDVTQRIEPFFQRWLKELNLFLNMIQRIEFLSDIYDSKSKNRTSFFQYDSKNRTPFFFACDSKFSNDLKNFFLKKFSKNWFFIWLKEWYLTQRLEILFLKFDSMNWTFFLMTRRLEVFFFSKIMTQRFFLKNMTQRIEPFFMTQRIEPFCMTQRIEPFFVWRKELNTFALNMTQRIEPFFLICRKELSFFFFAKFWLELSHFFINRTQRIELFLWLTELNLFFFHWYDSKNWTLCQKKATQKIEIFFFRKMTHRIELFVNDS